MKENVVKKHKKLHRNIYPEYRGTLRNFIIFLSVGCSSGDSVLDKIFGENSKYQLYWIMFSIILWICGYIYKHFFEKKNLNAYKVTKQFSGLYCIDNLGKLDLNNQNGLLSREEEVKYLKYLVEKILPQKTGKQGICLSGKSGCGKSTILYFLEQECRTIMEVYNYSKKYNSIEKYVKEDLGKNWEVTIKNSNKQYLFIFDQFEQFFYKNNEQQEKILKIIRKLAINNVAFIFSIREEFLLEFIKNIDINDLAVNRKEDIKFYGIVGNQQIVSSYEPVVEGNIPYFIICLDESESCGSYGESSMALHCEEAFGEERGKQIYSKFQNCTLIEQQIIYNILVNEKNSTGFMNLLDENEDFFIKRYYDVQLCSTGNFFVASRIMYLLSLGNFYHISFETEDIKRALCIPDIGSEKNEFNNVINKLHDVQFLKWAIYNNSTEVNEIAHDYIAKSYEAYANTEMSTDVRSAIDEYVTEYIKGTAINSIIDVFRKRRAQSSKVIWILWLSIAICIGGYVFYKVRGDNSDLIWIVLILILFSLVYAFTFYYNITRFCPNKRKIIVDLCFMISMISGILAILCYPFWLAWLGIGNASIGIGCLAIGLNKKISSVGKKMYQGYGVKTTLMGSLLTFLDIYLKLRRETSNTILIEIVAMGTLLIYAFYAHLNEEFIYTHLEGMYSSDI